MQVVVNSEGKMYLLHPSSLCFELDLKLGFPGRILSQDFESDLELGFGVRISKVRIYSRFPVMISI